MPTWRLFNIISAILSRYNSLLYRLTLNPRAAVMQAINYAPLWASLDGQLFSVSSRRMYYLKLMPMLTDCFKLYGVLEPTRYSTETNGS